MMGALEHWRENVTKFTEEQAELNAAHATRLDAISLHVSLNRDNYVEHLTTEFANAKQERDALAERVAELERLAGFRDGLIEKQHGMLAAQDERVERLEHGLGVRWVERPASVEDWIEAMPPLPDELYREQLLSGDWVRFKRAVDAYPLDVTEAHIKKEETNE